MSFLPLLISLLPAQAEVGPSQSRGLWVGGIQACRETLAGAEVTRDKWIDQSVLILTFRPEYHARLREQTKRLVGQNMPVRLDGRMIMEPLVAEPITGGSVQLAPLPDEGAEQLTDAVQRECVRDA